MVFRRTRSVRRSAVASRVVVVLAVVAVAGALGCSLAFPADTTQCATDDDCAARGGAFSGSVCEGNVCTPKATMPKPDARADAAHDAGRDAGRDATIDAGPDATIDARYVGDGAEENDWSCLGHVTEPDASAATVLLTVPYTDFLTQKPISGIRVQPCLRLDPACTNPVDDAGITNEAGLVTFTVPSGYNGYVLSLWEAGLPALDYLDPPIFATTVQRAQGLVSTSSLGILASAVGDVDGSAVTIEPNDGLFFLGAHDCRGATAAGVSFSISPKAAGEIEFYVVHGLPSVSATQTDSSGAGAFINVPVGSVTITATRVATGQVIGAVSGFSEAGRISGLTLPPEP